MKACTVNRGSLQNAVGITRKALSKVIIQQERGHLLFEVAGNTMKISGTNNDLKAQCLISLVTAVGEQDSFTADPKIMSGVLSKMDTDETTFEHDPDNHTLKIYTGKGPESFASLQSFPSSTMLTFEPNPGRRATRVSREMLASALRYSVNYMTPMTEDTRNFDIITISKGVMYAANGSSMMGFMQAESFKPLENLRLRKVVIPTLASVLESIEDESVEVIQTTTESGIETGTGTYFSCLNPAMDPPSVPIQNATSEGPYVLVERKLLLKYLDRLVVSHTGGGVIGLQIALNGSGESSYMDISLVSSKSVERVPCSRIDDPSDTQIIRFMEYKILKAILDSLEHADKMRLHINQDGGKFFKVYDEGSVGKETYNQVGIGAYVKILSKG